MILHLIFESKVSEIGLSVDPLDQLLNIYPEFGVAVIVTTDPELKEPEVGEALPPDPEVTVKVYCGVPGTPILGSFTVIKSS